MPKYKIGDKVKVIRETNIHPGLMDEMRQLLLQQRVFTISHFSSLENTIVKFKEDPGEWWWSLSWCIPEGPILSKEKELIQKINVLWTRQEYYKNHLTKA